MGRMMLFGIGGIIAVAAAFKIFFAIFGTVMAIAAFLIFRLLPIVLIGWLVLKAWRYWKMQPAE